MDATSHVRARCWWQEALNPGLAAEAIGRRATDDTRAEQSLPPEPSFCLELFGPGIASAQILSLTRWLHSVDAGSGREAGLGAELDALAEFPGQLLYWHEGHPSGHRTDDSSSNWIRRGLLTVVSAATASCNIGRLPHRPWTQNSFDHFPGHAGADGGRGNARRGNSIRNGQFLGSRHESPVDGGPAGKVVVQNKLTPIRELGPQDSPAQVHGNPADLQGAATKMD